MMVFFQDCFCLHLGYVPVLLWLACQTHNRWIAGVNSNTVTGSSYFLEKKLNPHWSVAQYWLVPLGMISQTNYNKSEKNTLSAYASLCFLIK